VCPRNEIGRRSCDRPRPSTLIVWRRVARVFPSAEAKEAYCGSTTTFPAVSTAYENETTMPLPGWKS